MLSMINTTVNVISIIPLTVTGQFVISAQIKVNKVSLWLDLRGFVKKISELIIACEK